MLGLIYVNYVAPFDAMTSFENFTLWGSPNWFGDPRIGSGIHWSCIPISVRGSPFWYVNSGIPVLVWGSPNRFGDSLELHPHFGLGIPVLVCEFRDPRFGLGIPELVRGFIGDASPFRFGDPRFGLGIPEPKWGSPH